MEVEGNWSVHLSETAETDFREIIRWTAERFGSQQADSYAKWLVSTLTRLTDGPELAGAKARDDIMDGLYTLHMGTKGRRFVLFRTTGTDRHRCVEVLRILHEAMELRRHLPGVDSWKGD